MPRRRNKKQKRDGSREHRNNKTPTANPTTTATTSNNNSLEEDLRLQRMRQQKRQEEAEKEKALAGPEPMIEEPPPQVDSSIIETVKPHAKQLLLKGAFPIKPIIVGSSNFSSSLSVACLLEQSPLLSSRYRQNLRQIWHSKYLLEQIHVNRRASILFSKRQQHSFRWMDHSLPDGMFCAWDMACKHNLHGSSRTLDVGYVVGENCLPTVATAVQGGWALLKSPHHASPERSVYTMRSKTVHSIRMHKNSDRCGTVLRWDNSSSRTPYKFRWYAMPHLTSYVEADLFEPVNDFCFGNELVLFACPRYYGGTTLSPMFMPLDDSGRTGHLRTLNVRNFPESDALRVEMSCAHNEKYVAFGHRNGQVSLIDLRQSSTVCSIFQHLPSSSSSSSSGGSATDLGFLKSATQLLVKRSFGTCQLHDLRLSSSSRTSSSVLFDLAVPTGGVLEAQSLHCNGFAVDPVGEQTLVSPYINAQHDACLGIWSLGTGIYIGSKVIGKNPDRDVIFTEVCQKTTPAFMSSSSSSTTTIRKQQRQQQTKKDDSSFGIWLKCGRFAHSKSKLNAKFGSLHHVTLPGSFGSSSSSSIKENGDLTTNG